MCRADYCLKHFKLVDLCLDTGMALFILYTTCAMILAWVPGVKTVRYSVMQSDGNSF